MTCSRFVAGASPCDDEDGFRSPIILFDTDCPLCSGMVAFVLAHERDHMMEAALAVLGIQGVLGAYDNIRNHEFRERLPHRSSQGSELVLHAAREGFYLVLFFTMAWLEWRGWCARLLGAVILAEIGVTCWDFVEEDRTRRLSVNECVLHTVLTLNYGAFLALSLAELVLTCPPRGCYGPAGGIVWGRCPLASRTRLMCLTRNGR